MADDEQFDPDHMSPDVKRLVDQLIRYGADDSDPELREVLAGGGGDYAVKQHMRQKIEQLGKSAAYAQAAIDYGYQQGHEEWVRLQAEEWKLEHRG